MLASVLLGSLFSYANSQNCVYPILTFHQSLLAYLGYHNCNCMVELVMVVIHVHVPVQNLSLGY